MASSINECEFNIQDLSSLSALETLILKGGFQQPSSAKLSQTLFNNVSNLRRLFLEKCNFQNMSVSTFQALVNLEVLMMVSCFNCSHLNLDVLPRLKWLQLDMNDNDFPCFQKLSSHLLVLNIGIFSSETESFQTLKNVKHDQLLVLCLRTNKTLDQLSWLLGFPNLKVFRLEMNGLETISFPDGLFNLEVLHLTHTMLESISDDTWSKLINLKTLNLRMNRLKLNRGSFFKGLEKLIKLDLSANELDSIDKHAFQGLVNLECLDLSNNFHMQILDPEVFACLPNLKHLRMDNTKIEIDTKTFSNLTRLKSLSIQYCKQHDGQFDGVFANMTELEVLDLSYAENLKITSAMFKGLGKLKELYLKLFQIEDFPIDVLLGLKSLRKIYLNPSMFTNEKLKDLKDKLTSIEIILE